MKKILVFGTDGVAKYLLENLIYDKVEILAFVNSDKNIRKYKFLSKEYNVITENEIEKYKFDYLIIASGSFSEIKNNLILKYNILEEKIVGFIFDDKNLYELFNSKINALYLEELNLKKVLNIVDKKLVKKLYLSQMWFVEENIINKDYVREKTLYLLSKEIKKKKIEGNVAELGVFKGEFSSKINEYFCEHEKKLYLFDTFEGFDRRDTTINENIGITFKNTSIQEVMNKMIYKNNCIVKQGYFPETFDIDDKFCFVSLDADLYEPILSGLEKFYPQLSKGGYIMVHDYYNDIYSGTRKAVDEFCQKNSINFIPVCDFNGSVIITKY